MKIKRIAGWSALGVGSLLAVDLAFSGSAGSPYGSFVAQALVGLVDQVSTALCTEGQACQTRATPYGALMVTPIDLSGNVITGGGGSGGGGGDVNITQVKGSAIDTNTGAASAATLRVVPATGSAVAATQSGTWTVQPGNTANTTPWLVGDGTGPFTVDGTVAATQSGTWTADTELPSAAALADGTSNPTVPSAGALNLLFNGTTWDRAPGTTANGALVNTELAAPAALADATSNPTVSSTGAFGLIWNGTTWDRQPGTAAAGTLSDTEMPAAAALATGMSNPTAPATGAFGMMWNGTTWDRVGGSAAAGVTVNTELPAAASITDNLSVSTTTTAAALTMGWDGSNWDRLPGNSSTGLTVNQATGWADVGNVAHDGVDSGNPVKIGMRAVALGANPTAVAAADRTDWLSNRAGIPFMLGGHMNQQSISSRIRGLTDGAQTDRALVAVSSGMKIVLMKLILCASTATVAEDRVVVGFGTANTPAPTLAGTSQLVFDGEVSGGTNSNPVCIPIGDGSGIIGIGADGEDLRYTASDPGASDNDIITVTATYFTVES